MTIAERLTKVALPVVLGAGLAAVPTGSAYAHTATLPSAGTAVRAAASCTMRHVSHYSPWANRSYTADWVCGNRNGVALHGWGSYDARVTGWLDTGTSWFVCWGPGNQHAGGNNIWYYTKGDRMQPGNENAQGWGFAPAVDVWTSTDPVPGMPKCDFA